VELPIGSILDSTKAETAAETLLTVRDKAILVIDDQDGIRRALARLLSRDGHEVETAAKGRIALDQLQNRPYDLILCDWRMPVLDGPSFYRELE
jgi:CheY-like chemotaxis protein